MSWRLVVADAGRARGLGAALAAATGDTSALVVVVGTSQRLWRRQTEARLARSADLLVETGGRPADGMLLLSTLSVDVVRSTPLALSTHRDKRRRGAVVAQVAPLGRSDSARTLFIGVDLDPVEWAHHELELRQRLEALDFDVTVPTYVAAIDRRLAVYPDFSPPPSPPADPTWLTPSSPNPLTFDLPA